MQSNHLPVWGEKLSLFQTLKFIFLWLKRWLYRAFINTSSVGYGAATKSEATITLFVSINGTISKLKSKRDKIIFISIIANFCPIQFRAPALNGIKANGWREVSSREFVSWRNRSGLKTNGSLKFSGSVCITSVAFSRSIKVQYYSQLMHEKDFVWFEDL